MRYLGIDYGTKKVGIAVSDESGQMGFPHSVLPNDERLLSSIVALLRKEDAEAIVMGESLALDGSDNPVAKEAKAFAEALKAEAGVPVYFEMEAFTTQEAGRGIDGARGGTREGVDAQAAALILTSYLGRNHGNDWRPQ